MKKRKILFLFTELSDYFLASINAGTRFFEITIVHYEVNKEAPFEFEDNNHVHFYVYQDLPSLKLITQLSAPDLVICSGWSNNDYIKLMKTISDPIKRVIVMDNHWKNTLTQVLGVVYFKLFLRPIFSKIWVPGPPQVEFAKRLGFSNDQIYDKFYVANPKNFSPEIKLGSKKIIYVGRYLEWKGIYEMFGAFVKFYNSGHMDWELHCVGVGELWKEKIIHPGIIHHGFIQPNELQKLIKKMTFFILPSHYEAWGVVVHEMAMSGLVLLLSDKIGAASSFLVDGQNGFTFKSKSQDAIIGVLNQISNLSSLDIQQMSIKSIEYSKGISQNDFINVLNIL